jgi:hypothetical protein
MALADIYSVLGSDNPFKKDGKLSKSGHAAHEKLYKIIVQLHEIGVIKETPDEVEKEIDFIIEFND